MVQRNGSPTSVRSIGNNATHNREGPTFFHIIPHSHCDAAYKKSFDEYYETEVRNVFQSILGALHNDKSRRFVWAETIYLTRWWKDPRTNLEQKKIFQELLIKGQIEIVNGGWVMHDEGITRYDSQIHQMTEGHDRLHQMLLDDLRCPNVTVVTGWQIDPFGPSPFSVNLHDWAGMDFLVLNRMPTNIKDAIKANKTLQFYWETEQAKILVNVMDTHYASPEGFDWEDLEHGESIPITKENLRERSDIFMNVLFERATHYRTQHVMVPMGGDFTYQNASLQFENMERIFKFVQDHPILYGTVTFRYSTPVEYRDAIMNAFSHTNQSIPVVYGGVEFQPLLAGYYFQLPNLKQMVRTCEVMQRVVEVRIYQALNRDLPWRCIADWLEEARSTRETIALLQHHDAITATSYRFVVADYIQRLSSTFNQMARILSHMEGGQDTELSHPLTLVGEIIGGGPYLHESVLLRDAQSARSISITKVLSPQMGFDGTMLIVLNSLAQETTTLVHFVCTRADVAISLVHDDGSLEPILAQATPLDRELEVSNLGLYLISYVVTIPGLGKAHHRVQVCDLTWNTFQDPPAKISDVECAQKAQPIDATHLARIGLVSSNVQVSFNESTLELLSMKFQREDGTQIVSRLDHDFIIYYGGNDTIYQFATNVASSNPPPLYGSRRRRFICGFEGPLFSQVTLEYTPWLSIRYRLENFTSTKLEKALQATVFAGPLPPSVNLASRFRVGWPDTEWWVDENGFLPVRVSYNASHGVGDGNSRPLVSRSWIEEDRKGKRLTVFSVDPRAVISKRNGQMDVFWHRRNNFSLDWWKQGEDRSSIVSSVWLSLGGNTEHEELMSRQLATQLSNDVVVMSMPTINKHNASFGNNILQPSLHSVTLRVSQVDPGIDSHREEVWIDLQIENLSRVSTEQVDLVAMFTNSTKVFLPAAMLCSLTYLKSDSVGLHAGCTLDALNGGRLLLLSVAPRMLCSLRIPVAPVRSKLGNSLVKS